MSDASVKLAHLFELCGVPADQFVQEYRWRFQRPRRPHIERWISGEQVPYGRSLENLTVYWREHIDGMQRSWWLRSFDEFRALCEEGRRQGRSRGLDLTGATGHLTEHEIADLSGTHMLYRYSTSQPGRVTIEAMELRRTENIISESARFLLATLHSPALIGGSERHTFVGKLYRLGPAYYAMLSTSIDTIMMRSLIMPADTAYEYGRVRVGIMSGISDIDNTPVAATFVLDKIDHKLMKEAICRRLGQHPRDEVSERIKGLMQDVLDRVRLDNVAHPSVLRTGRRFSIVPDPLRRRRRKRDTISGS